MIINEEKVRKLAALARIDLSEFEVENLTEDFEKILNHFEELKNVDTDGVLPMTGGTFEENSHRHDDDNFEIDTLTEKLKGAFPEKDGNFLKIPPVFE